MTVLVEHDAPTAPDDIAGRAARVAVWERFQRRLTLGLTGAHLPAVVSVDVRRVPPVAGDGLTSEFGKERLADCVGRNREKNAQEIVEAVLAEVNAFAISGRYTDDKVLMIMKVTTDGKVQTAKQTNWPAEKERRTDPRIPII